jgi:hypothetical protein
MDGLEQHTVSSIRNYNKTASNLVTKKNKVSTPPPLSLSLSHTSSFTPRRGVALQVEFERQTLKPVFPLDWL